MHKHVKSKFSIAENLRCSNRSCTVLSDPLLNDITNSWLSLASHWSSFILSLIGHVFKLSIKLCCIEPRSDLVCNIEKTSFQWSYGLGFATTHRLAKTGISYKVKPNIMTWLIITNIIVKSMIYWTVQQMWFF